MLDSIQEGNFRGRGHAALTSAAILVLLTLDLQCAKLLRPCRSHSPKRTVNADDRHVHAHVNRTLSPLKCWHLASTVRACIPEGSPADIQVRNGEADEIDWLVYQKRGCPSPVAAADADVCAQFPKLFAWRKLIARRKLLRYWVDRAYTGTPARHLNALRTAAHWPHLCSH